MCGIVGVFGSESANQEVIKGLKILFNRGRDGYGIFDGKNVSYSDNLKFDDLNNSNLSIGHCLHAVVNKVRQPFKVKGVFAVNGEIYNWSELSNKYNIKAKNDAELFFLLLEKLGVNKTLKLVDGDYAGVYYRNDKIYLFRDRIGVKPLWYSLEKGLAFSSERKVLRSRGYFDVIELNPREILVYDTKNKEYTFEQRGFFHINKLDLEYKELVSKLSFYLINSVTRRIPDVKLGLLFSGGLDSTIIALILKNLGIEFKCYFAYVDGLGIAQDLDYAVSVSKELGLDLEIVKVDLDEVEKNLNLICQLVESNNVTKISVALPFYFALERAKKDKVKVMLSGQGSEELFAGYDRHIKSDDVNKECYNGLLNIYEKDLYRDDVIAMYNSIELRVPFLDSWLVNFGLSIDGKYKINQEGNKVILRHSAIELGLKEHFAFRKRKAAQYGSNFLKAIDKLSRNLKFNSKSEYLKSLYDEGNVKLAGLLSSGKDSLYAMYTMIKQNYEIRCAVTINSKNKYSYMYHTPNVEMVKLQTEAMKIPLIMFNSNGDKEDELEDLEAALIQAKEDYKIEGVVSGAIYSKYQRDRVQKVADKLGLKVFTPLWHMDQERLLRELLKNKFRFIISSVASDGLGEKWLGREIGLKEVDELVKLSKKYGIHPAFEGGEAESLVLDCPMFKKKLNIEDAKKIIEDEYSGFYFINKAQLIDKN